MVCFEQLSVKVVGATHFNSLSDLFTINASPNTDAPRSEMPFPLRLKMGQKAPMCFLQSNVFSTHFSFTSDSFTFSISANTDTPR